MENVIKLKKGLDINLKGKATLKCTPFKLDKEYALVPDAFIGMTPKVVVREGDHVKAGEPLFVNKKFPEVGFASPVSGTVTAVIRGERRKLLCVKVESDSKQDFVDYGKKDPSTLSGDEVLQHLLSAGLFGFMRQLPYAVSAEPSSMPKAIFVSAFRDMPLAADFDYEIEGNEKYFATGLIALSRIAETHVGLKAGQNLTVPDVKGLETHVFSGPCPVGNVGVQVNHISPVNKGDVVWTADPMVVVFIGRLFLDGKVDLHKRIAIAGSEVKNPEYAEVLVGQPIKPLLENQLTGERHLRIIDGNPLTGKPCGLDHYVGALTSEITVIPEGDDRDEFIGWIMPRFKDFSANRSYFSWLMGKKKEYTLDARIKGGARHIIMSGEYDRVLPMDIYGEYLIKAIIAGDIDKMEQLGIYEVSPEDFAVAEFVDSSKLELQRIVREGLDMLRKENA
ncbi:MAG: Na(+)-translocating NADH-quinone reductase subunit A [Prevotella sp.]|nr:Na(+)-translocating NADH-quinone reductase subunit A [Prevotella sp.]